MNTALLVLAAGASTRMGQPKQLLPYASSTLLGHVVDAAIASGCGPVFVVLGANASAIREALAGRSVQIVPNPDWESGQGSSIACGVRAAKAAGCEGVLILLGDQPEIGVDIIRGLVGSATENPGRIVAAQYDGVVGVPALFPERFFDELASLQPEQGAKPLLARHSAMVKVLTVESNPDVDTRSDYEAALARSVH